MTTDSGLRIEDFGVEEMEHAELERGNSTKNSGRNREERTEMK